jgi:hypothetical protein
MTRLSIRWLVRFACLSARSALPSRSIVQRPGPLLPSAKSLTRLWRGKRRVAARPPPPSYLVNRKLSAAALAMAASCLYRSRVVVNSTTYSFHESRVSAKRSIKY